MTNPLSRHPVVTASAAAMLDELAPGRTYIGIGSGDTGVLHLGLAGATLARLEQYVLALRRLLEDGQAAYDGQTLRLNWARQRIPIIVAAHGAKSLRLAGRIGDGVVVGLGVTPEAVQGALALLDEGAREAGRRLADIMEAKLAREGRDQWYNLHLVHTNLSERIAFHSIISLARAAGVPLYLAHVTGVEGVAAIAAACGQGQPVFGEVLHNYLCYTADDYQQPDGGKYQTYPALKSEADRLALWDGLVQGSLSVVATDEYTTSYQIKTQGQTIATACGGHAGIETRGIIAFSEGYRTGRFSLERFVEVFSTNPAKILSLYPQKGAILPGSEADLVLWDPAVQKTIQLTDLHHDSDYGIWEGWPVQGWPVMTLLRGQVVVEAGQLLRRPADGRFVKRKLQPAMLSAAGA